MSSGAKRWGQLALAALLIGLGSYVAWRTHCGSTDFDTYYCAARRVLTGLPLYVEVPGTSPYIYPPTFACILTPLALFNIETASIIWYAINIAFMWAGLAISFRLIFGTRDPGGAMRAIPLFPKALFAVFAAVTFLDNISLLQVNIMVFFLAVAALHFSKSERDFVAAFCLALAVSIKVLPALLLVYFILKRRFALVAAAVAHTALLVFVLPAFSMGLRDFGGAFSVWVDHNLLRPTAQGANFETMGSMFNPVNQSIQAFVSRWFVRSDSNIYYWKNVAYRYGAFFAGIRGCLSDAVGLAVSKAAASVLIAAGFAASFIGLKRRGDDADGAAYSVAILACLLASPIVRVQYFIFAVFPAMLVLGRASSYNIKKRLAGYCLGLFAALYFSLGIKPFRIAGCGAIALVLLYAVIAYGTLSEKTDT